MLIPKSDLRQIKKQQIIEPGTKKREVKAEEKKDVQKLEVRDYLLENEKRIHTRNSILQCPRRSFLKVLLKGY